MLLTAKPGINLVMSYIIQSIQTLLVLLGLLLRLPLAHILQQDSIVNLSSDLTSTPSVATKVGKLSHDPQQHTCVQATWLYIEGSPARHT